MFPSRGPQYELVSRNSADISNGLLVDHETLFPTKARRKGSFNTLLGYLTLPFRIGRVGKRKRTISRLVSIFVCLLAIVIVYTPIFNPSYSTRPQHYTGTNAHQEKVFIAANIVDKDLIRGAWGDAILGLIDIIGPENTFLSIYENDSGPETKEALKELEAKVKCRKSIISGHIDIDDFQTVQFLPNERRVKRINYLAAVRNHALDPLDQHNYAKMMGDQAPIEDMKFDRLLFVNDVVFSPKDAADLLFATNAGANGKADYQAACAMDYINPIKFYDRFALRDSAGFEAGVPFYPWFTRSGGADTWAAVMGHSDAVPVKSCWGGMVAFEAKWFQRSELGRVESSTSRVEPLQFRAEPETFWDASECCLIHADLQRNFRLLNEDVWGEAKIFVNPFVRVAYDSSTFARLELSRRFEKLYAAPHIFISWLIGMPWGASRRTEKTGALVQQQQWKYTGPSEGDAMAVTTVNIGKFGHWEQVENRASAGGFCGYDFLLALKTKWEPGERMWEKITPPSPPKK